MTPTVTDHLEELRRELDRAELVATGEVVSDVVTMHSTLRVRDLDRGKSVVYTIVFPVDADIEKKRIWGYWRRSGPP